jgi:hypothetical protein
MLIANTTTSRTTLHGHVAVVTGAGQGIGKETARALAYLGACVAIAEINESGLETQCLIQSEGGTALFVKTEQAVVFQMSLPSNILYPKRWKFAGCVSAPPKREDTSCLRPECVALTCSKLLERASLDGFGGPLLLDPYYDFSLGMSLSIVPESFSDLT